MENVNTFKFNEENEQWEALKRSRNEIFKSQNNAFLKILNIFNLSAKFKNTFLLIEKTFLLQVHFGHIFNCNIPF